LNKRSLVRRGVSSLKEAMKRAKITSAFAIALSLPTHPPDVLITGFKLEQSKNNKKFFEMAAPAAELFKAEQIAKANFPETKIYQKDSTKPIELKASEALAHMVDYDMLFKGATEVKSPDGFIVQGRNLAYSHKDEKISTDEGIQFESTPEFRASLIQGWGKGFEADLTVKSFNLKEDVNINIIPREMGGTPSKIKGRSAKVFTDKGWAQIEGSVAFQKQNLSVRSDFLTLDFDILGKKQGEEAIFQSSGKSYVIALYDQYRISSKEITLFVKGRKEIGHLKARGEVTLTDDNGTEMRMENLEMENPQEKSRQLNLKGNVFVRKGDIEAKCDEANYDPETDSYVFKGNAAFRKGQNMMGGREIVYSIKTGVLQVHGASGQFQKNTLIPKKSN
jgi:lipopolysaccharide transport protein LptA